MEVIVLPCNDPPGVSLKITYFGNVVFDQIVADDVETNIAPGKLTVTFTELENAIGVEVCAIPFRLLLCNIPTVLAKDWRATTVYSCVITLIWHKERADQAPLYKKTVLDM